MDLRRVDLNTLVALQALLADASVTRAAERLSIGQPAMSATLSRLRRQFDDPLLVREGRDFVLTPRARALIEPLNAILGDIEGLLGTDQPFDPATARRVFTVMTPEYIPPIFLQPFLEGLARDAPGLEVHLLAASANAGEQLRQGGIDLLLHPRETLPRWRRFCNQMLFRDRYVAVVDATNGSVVEELTEEQLRTLPYLAMSFDARPSYADTQLEQRGIVPNRVIVASGAMGPFLIRGTRLITIAHESLARFAIEEAGTLRIRELPIELADLTEGMFWLPRYDADAGHRWLRSTLAEVIQSSPARPSSARVGEAASR